MVELGKPGGSLLTKRWGKGPAQELLRAGTWGVQKAGKGLCMFCLFSHLMLHLRQLFHIITYSFKNQFRWLHKLSSSGDIVLYQLFQYLCVRIERVNGNSVTRVGAVTDEPLPGSPRRSSLTWIKLLNPGSHVLMGILLTSHAVRLNQMDRGLENALTSE